MNDIYVGALFSETYLEHHGIKGMHWGVRRFQREDGTLTSAGKKRKVANEHAAESKKKGLSDRQKTALKVGAAVAVGGLAAYAGYKAYKNYSDPSMIEKIAKKQRDKTVSKAAKKLFNERQIIGRKKIQYNKLTGKNSSDEPFIKRLEQNSQDRYQKAKDKANQKYENAVAKAKMREDVKNRHSLSEAELDAKLARVKKELELKRVTAENLSTGRSEVDSIIRSSGKKVAGTVLTGSMLYGIKYGLTGKYDARDAANYVAPRPKQK